MKWEACGKKPVVLLWILALVFLCSEGPAAAGVVYVEDFQSGKPLSDLGFTGIRRWESDPTRQCMKSVSPGGGNDPSEVFSAPFTADRNGAGILSAEWKLQFPTDSSGKAWRESNRVWVSLADASGNLLYTLFFSPHGKGDQGKDFDLELSRGSVHLEHGWTRRMTPTFTWLGFRMEVHPTSAAGGDGTLRIFCDMGDGTGYAEVMRVAEETHTEFHGLHFRYKTGSKEKNYQVLADDIRVSAGDLTPLPQVNFTATPSSVFPGGEATLAWTTTQAHTVRIDPGIGEAEATGSLKVSPTETTTYTLTATGEGGTTTRSVTVTVTPFPSPTVSLSAAPETIGSGASAILSWTSTDATSAFMDQGVGEVGVNGSLTVSPTETTTYTITVTGPGGTATARATVTVSYPQPTVTLSAGPEVIGPGESATLSWTSSHTTGAVMDQGIGEVGLSGSLTVSPAQTTTYTLTVTGPGGTATASVTVSYPQPSVTLTVIPDTLPAGESATLSWSSVHAASALIDQGIGEVPTEGSVTVSPTQTTTYTITVTGPGGTATAAATVSVIHPEPEASFSANPEAIPAGQSATLTWTTSYAESCVIQPDVGTVSAGGSVSVSPTQTTTYTLTATGPGGTATASVTVTVSQPLPTVTINAGPGIIRLGESATLSWSTSYATYAMIDQGIGEVVLNGSQAVSPAETTVYTITAVGPGGTATAQVQVSVRATITPQPEGSFGSRYEDLIPMDATVSSYDPKRFSVITGLVRNPEGYPGTGVTTGILHHPEYGTALTDAEGRFSLPVEGGNTLTVVYETEGLLTVHRQVGVPWNDIAIAETVVMTAKDPLSTVVHLDGNPATVTIHQSRQVADAFGSRSCTTVFTGDNRAQVIDTEGNLVRELNSFTTRSTEYHTPESMPAVLPPGTAYAYGVELDAEGETQTIRFGKPVVAWVDNFLGFPVGEVVPVGYYDRDQGVWISSEDGRVVQILDTDGNGLADGLDADGDGQPDDLDADGVFGDEVTGLDDPQRYPPGSTFWRFSVPHFSVWACGWPYGPPVDIIAPNGRGEPLVDQKKEDPTDTFRVGDAAVEDRARIFHEDIPIPGTGMSLHYASDRAEGYVSVVNASVSGEAVPGSLIKIIVQLTTAGRTIRKVLDPLPNQQVTLEWDGKDYLGKTICGPSPAQLSIGFVYPVDYSRPQDLIRSFGYPGLLPFEIVARQDITSWKHFDLTIRRNMGDTMAKGWTLSAHHHFSPLDPTTAHRGDGTIGIYRPSVLSLVANYSGYGYSGDGGPALKAQFYSPHGLAMDGAGNLYIADLGNHRIRKITPDGIITTVAGNGIRGYEGDGGPATSAQLNGPTDVAVDDRGNLYIADQFNHRIRKVNIKGTISTIAGTGEPEMGDGIIDVGLFYPNSVAVDHWGNVYFGEGTGPGLGSVWKIDSQGTLTLFAGKGGDGYSGDGGPATEASLYSSSDLVVDEKGNVYIADTYNHCVRKVDSQGIITTIAGDGTAGYSGDGGLATRAQFGYPVSLALGEEGTLYVGDAAYNRIRKIDPMGLVSTVAGNGEKGVGGLGDFPTRAQISHSEGMVLSPSKKQVYISDKLGHCIRKFGLPTSLWNTTTQESTVFMEEFDQYYILNSKKLHGWTFDRDTNVLVHTFSYDSEDRLIAITDASGNQTYIARGGTTTEIISPDGITTSLSITNDLLSEVRYADGSEYSFTYTPKGLMTSKTDPKRNRYERRFDTKGRLIRSTDPEGGFWAYDSSGFVEGSIRTKVNTGENNQTAYLDRWKAGEYTSEIAIPTGEVISSKHSYDKVTDEASLLCGVSTSREYGVDPGYRFRYPREVKVRMPSGRQRVTQRSHSYTDRNGDRVADLITKAITMNGRQTTQVIDTFTATKKGISPEGREVLTYYDPKTGATVWRSIPGLYHTEYDYDSRGRLTSLYTLLRLTGFSYDQKGNLASVTDPEGKKTSYEYDAVGRVKAVHRPDGTSVGYSYDANGNMILFTVPDSAQHRFGHDRVNLETSYEPPVSGTYSYAYDTDKRLIRVLFPSGRKIENSYENARLKQILTPEGITDFSYRCGSLVGKVSRGTEALSFDYDGTLVTSESLTGTLSGSLTYAYNNDFDLTRFTYAGDSVDYTYDRDSLLTGAGPYRIGRNPANGLPDNVSDSTLLIERFFNGYGESDAQLLSVAGENVSYWEIGRSPSGRILTKTEIFPDTFKEYTYTYDNSGRLLTVNRNGVLVEEYHYDVNGNRILENNLLRGLSRSFTYSEEDQCVYSQEDHDLTPVNYQYDADGFLTEKTGPEGTTTYTYSSRGELLRVTLPDSTLIEYVHDPLTRRIAKKVNGAITQKYLWQGQTRLLAVYDGSDELLMRFEYADERMPVAMTKDGVRYYLAYDQVGSLRAVADAGGNVIKKIDYDSFGNILYDTNPLSDIPFGFAGGLHDRDTGLVRFGVRDYDPDTGRWTAKDPIGFGGGDSNLYGYCLGDPINAVDLYGLYSSDDLIQDTANVSAGFGDTISFGLTDWVRDRMGTNSNVDKRSGLYTVGEIGGYAWFTATAWTGGLYGGSSSVFWSGEGNMVRAAQYGTNLEKTPIGYLLNRTGEKVPYFVWKATSATFAGNARKTAIKVGIQEGYIWRKIENPILKWRGIKVDYIP